MSKPPDQIDESIIHSHGDLASNLLHAISSARSYGVETLSQFFMFCLVGEVYQSTERADGVALGKPAKMLGMTPASATANCDRLVSLGLVETKQNGNDRRKRLMFLTGKGKELYTIIRSNLYN